MARRIESLARDLGAELLVFDPALPIGALGPHLADRGFPYAVVLHGAEVTVPGRLPVARTALARSSTGRPT
jgi:phosphatidyl-myo-inositol dimannoside synthase